jgi:hypothetical protein
VRESIEEMLEFTQAKTINMMAVGGKLHLPLNSFERGYSRLQTPELLLDLLAVHCRAGMVNPEVFGGGVKRTA